MEKKKILFLITKATWGGAQRYVFDLVTNLQKEKFEPVVAYGTEGKLARDLPAAGIKVRQLRSLARDIALFSDIQSFFEILKVIRKNRPDVVHLNSSKAAAFGALAARIAGVPKIIFTAHGWPFKERKNILWRTFVYAASWLTALLSHEIVVVSGTDEQLGIRMWGVSKKIRFIPLGLEPFHMLPPAQAFRAMFGSLKPAPLQSATLRLVSIGELTANKGLCRAIAAVALLSERGIDAVYVVVGEGEERDTLKVYSEKLGIADRVFFPGFVAGAAQNLSGFDTFLLPSVKEGTPYVLLEALAAGIPIIATSVIDTDFADNPLVHIIPPADSLVLADAIAEFSRIPRAQSNEENRFPLAEMLKRTTELYLS